MSIEKPETETERAMPIVLLLAGGGFMALAFGTAGTALSGYALSFGLAFTFLGMLWILKYPAYSLRVKPTEFSRMDEHE